MNEKKLNHLTMVPLFSVLAFILMYFSFSIPVISPFAEFDLSAIPELIGGFMLGPVGGVEIVGVKILLKLVFKGSTSMLTGEVQNFILETAFVLPAALYYKYHKTKKGAVTGLILGGMITVVVSVFTNIYLIFPAYIKLYGMNWDGIVQICTAVNPYIKDVPTLIAFSIVPFNIISRTITAVVTVLVYKRISILLKG